MSGQRREIGKSPKVTVLMAVYNGERYLRDAINSILKQTYTDFEFLIVNDCSTDSSRKIILSYSDSRIRLVENIENIGLTKSLNMGLSLCRGEYIARQDADDISLPTRLEKQVSCLNARPGIALLGTQTSCIDQNGNRFKSIGLSRAESVLAIRWQLLFGNPFAHSSVMIRTNVLRDLGGYDEHFVTSQDFDLWSRLLHRYDASNLNEALISVRSHSDSLCSRYTAKNMSLIREVLQREFRECLKEPPPVKWVDGWLNIILPYVESAPTDVRNVLGFIGVIYMKFVALNPSAHSNIEIRKHIASLYLWISYNAALNNRPASLYGFFLAASTDVYLALTSLPKYSIALLLGRHRRFVATVLSGQG
jgi:glycosyltransferase involved in cell wall biosynthesis